MIEAYNHQLKKEIFKVSAKRRRKTKKNPKTTEFYCENIFTFDIETTSCFCGKDNIPFMYRKGESSEYWNNLTPLSLCYIWQFSYEDNVYYGRELSDFLEVLKDFPKDTKCIIWVHNLAFEFQFLRNILTWDKIFARSPHKPMKAISKEFPNIEFRCTYYLTRLSLDDWGKSLNVNKAVGVLDYNVMRTPLTPMTEKELYYCEMDCRVPTAGIRSFIETYGSIWNIPLTQTGTVRRVVKERTTSDEDYVKNLKRMIPRNAEEYKRLQTVFAGGYTHANRLYSGHVIEEKVEHYDFASSYPTVMVAEKFPMSGWIYTGHFFPDQETFNDYAYILELHFLNIQSTSFNTYIQASKCYGSEFKYDNGRIMSAAELYITITEQDFLTIQENYTWEDMEVIHVYKSKKEYLPKVIVDYVLELYGNKTKLKDVEGQEKLYAQSKQFINSLFGMCVTALIQADVTMDKKGTWHVDVLTKEMVDKKLKQLKNRNPREKRYFLNYSWGCWISAYARRNLWECIGKNDHDVIYADTDSIFMRGTGDFQWYNEQITEKLKKACEFHGIDFELTQPTTPKGKKKPLGIFDREDDCEEFITLGAKRYCERRAKDHQLHLTISGINKGAVKMLQNDIFNFRDGFVFDKDDDSVKKKLSIYIEDMPEITFPDGYVMKAKKGINLRNNGYVLSVTDEYKRLINLVDNNTMIIPDRLRVSMRGRFEL